MNIVEYITESFRLFTNYYNDLSAFNHSTHKMTVEDIIQNQLENWHCKTCDGFDINAGFIYYCCPECIKRLADLNESI